MKKTKITIILNQPLQGEYTEQVARAIIGDRSAFGYYPHFSQDNVSVEEIDTDKIDLSFQNRVFTWIIDCFGQDILNEKTERSNRFMEEAIELAQSVGYDQKYIIELVKHVYEKPAGNPLQETGNVMVTLAALSLCLGIDMHICGEYELARISTPEMIDRIRIKNRNKAKGSPIPGTLEPEIKPATFELWLAELKSTAATRTNTDILSIKVNESEARKFYDSGFTPEQCFRETWGMENDGG